MMKSLHHHLGFFIMSRLHQITASAMMKSLHHHLGFFVMVCLHQITALAMMKSLHHHLGFFIMAPLHQITASAMMKSLHQSDYPLSPQCRQKRQPERPPWRPESRQGCPRSSTYTIPCPSRNRKQCPDLIHTRIYSFIPS